MILLDYIFKKFFLILGIVFLTLTFTSCGIYKPVDARKVSPNADERVKKNLEEGRGFTLKGAFGGDNKGTGGSFSFASSNPMWRATLEILDFIPLSNIDYAGGIIITDWYTEGTSADEAIKITVRFLTTEVRADGIKIIVHKKKCTKLQNCAVQKVNSALESELQVAILRKAAIYERDWLKKNKNKRPDLKD
tara:strand:- start:302 stop:877 length:576 start_codon:yes stop_codon:yes gene_type:complete